MLCVKFGSEAVDLDESIFPNDIVDVIKENRKDALGDNDKALNYFNTYGVPGAYKDIYFNTAEQLISELFLSLKTKITDCDKIVTFWIPLENHLNKEPFSITNIKLITESEGFNSKDEEIGEEYLEKIKLKLPRLFITIGLIFLIIFNKN